MSKPGKFSFGRLRAMVVKEFIQMKRDRMTFGMIFGIPIMQIFLFGFVIESDPRHLPAAVHLQDGGPHGRTLLSGLKNSTFYDFQYVIHSEAEGRQLLLEGKVQFVITIPPNFSRDLQGGARPVLLVEADASDPTATGGGLNALDGVIDTAMQEDFKGALARFATARPAIDTRIHALYNPERLTSHNIVPGLMGVVLTLTLVMITALAITRERERGTMENLLAMPLRPSEVLIGKILLYVVIGYIQIGIIMLVSRAVFGVPMEGDLGTLLVGSLFYIAANLSMGITFSTLARNQLQAMQMAMFVFLPSMLLSGFMFPFRGMPQWAQWLGEILPITHFIRIARAVMLKGATFTDVQREVVAIGVFTVVMMTLGIKRYRQTLD